MLYMLDTNIARYIVQDEAKAANILQHIDRVGHGNIVMSALVAQELAVAALNHKISKKARDAFESILHFFSLVAFDDRAAQQAAYVEADLKRAGAMIGKMDALIAGHAKGLGMTLVTHNTGEFSRVSGLKLEDWTK